MATSIADGGDFLAIDAAVERNYALHLFLPFSAEDFIAEQCFSQEDKAKFQSFWESDETSPIPLCEATRTEIDLGENEAKLSPYASCGRLMLDHADVLVALWNGETDKGPGGTRHVMRDAQRRGQTVVRIHPNGSVGVWVPSKDSADPSIDGIFTDDPEAPKGFAGSEGKRLEENMRRLINPPTLWDLEEHDEHHGHFAQGVFSWLWAVLDWVGDCVTNGVYGSYAKEQTAAGRLKGFKAEKARPKTIASGFYLLQLLFGVRRLFWPVLNSYDSNRRSWDALAELSSDIGGQTFSQRIENTVFSLWHQSDGLAVYTSHVFRTAYILSFVLSVLAVATGLFIVFEGDKKVVYEVKGALVSIELGIIALILLLLYFGARRRWQKRWIDYRTLAEILRSTRLPLLIGSVPARSEEPSENSGSRSWIAWYVRSHLRSIPPPDGRLGPDELHKTIRFAIEHELTGQIEYHRENSERLATLDHRMHLFATTLLVVTVLGGLAYLGLLLLDQVDRYEVFKPYVTFLGGILPVCSAAINGIRATGDFRSAANQSERMADALEDLRARLDAEARHVGGPRRFHVRVLLDETVRVMADDLNVWGMIYSQRELGVGVE